MVLNSQAGGSSLSSPVTIRAWRHTCKGYLGKNAGEGALRGMRLGVIGMRGLGDWGKGANRGGWGNLGARGSG